MGRRGFLHQKSSIDSVTTRSACLIAYRLAWLQAVVVVIIALCWCIRGITEALSAFLGGAVCVILPNLHFAWRLFAITVVRTAKQIMINFFLGELIKLVLSAVLVILIVMFTRVSIVPFIVGFVGAQFGFWFAPLGILGSQLNKVKSTQ